MHDKCSSRSVKISNNINIWDKCLLWFWILNAEYSNWNCLGGNETDLEGRNLFIDLSTLWPVRKLFPKARANVEGISRHMLFSPDDLPGHVCCVAAPIFRRPDGEQVQQSVRIPQSRGVFTCYGWRSPFPIKPIQLRHGLGRAARGIELDTEG